MIRWVIVLSVFMFSQAWAKNYSARLVSEDGQEKVCVTVEGTMKCSRPVAKVSHKIRRRVRGLGSDISKGFFSMKTLEKLKEDFDPRQLLSFKRNEACGNIDRIKEDLTREIKALEKSKKQYSCQRVPAVPR